MARFNPQSNTSSVLTGVFFLSCLLLGAPLSATEAPAVSGGASSSDSLEGRTRFDRESKDEEAKEAAAREKLAKDNLRMVTHVGDAQPIDFQDFYPFPDPVPAKQPSKAGSNKTLYWIGATGVALAAGVAAYFIFSAEPESGQTIVAVHQL